MGDHGINGPRKMLAENMEGKTLLPSDVDIRYLHWPRIEV